jgi:hypothetical protein
MTFEKIFWVAMAVLVLIVLPIAMTFTVWQQLRAAKRGETDKQRERSRVAIGNALQELDRLVARPAVEFTVEAERPILKREDDKGGD